MTADSGSPVERRVSDTEAREWAAKPHWKPTATQRLALDLIDARDEVERLRVVVVAAEAEVRQFYRAVAKVPSLEIPHTVLALRHALGITDLPDCQCATCSSLRSPR